jgi:hypothetical protein
MAGRVRFTGGAAATTEVAEAVALADPPAFLAVTCTEIVAPTSALVRVNVGEAAFGMEAQT